jgi:hypothetical protein
MAGMIAVITSVIAGAFAALLLSALFGLSLGVVVVVGIATFLASVALLQRYQWQQWGSSSASVSVRFPSGADD